MSLPASNWCQGRYTKQDQALVTSTTRRPVMLRASLRKPRCLVNAARLASTVCALVTFY